MNVKNKKTFGSIKNNAYLCIVQMNKRKQNQLILKVMFTIDKEYLKALKKRLSLGCDSLNTELSKDCTDERRESLNAKKACVIRTICNVQNVINDLTLLELAERVKEDKGE